MRESTRFLLFIAPVSVAIGSAATATDVWLGKGWTCSWLAALCVGLFLKIRRLDYQ